MAAEEQELTAKQKRFVDAYLGAARFNAAEAARLAGYSAKTAPEIGRENLRKPTVQAAIKDRVNEYAMSAEEVLSRLAEQARGDLGDCLTINEFYGKPTVDLRRVVEKGKTHLLKRVQIDPKTGVSVEMYDAQSALEKLGKYHRLFVDRQESNTTMHVEGGVVVYMPDNGRGSSNGDEDGTGDAS